MECSHLETDSRFRVCRRAYQILDGKAACAPVNSSHVARYCLECASTQTNRLPFVPEFSPQLPVEIDSRSVPIQHVEHHAVTAILQGNSREAREQRSANIFPSELSADENIFQKKHSTFKRRIVI